MKTSWSPLRHMTQGCAGLVASLFEAHEATFCKVMIMAKVARLSAGPQVAHHKLCM